MGSEFVIKIDGFRKRNNAILRKGATNAINIDFAKNKQYFTKSDPKKVKIRISSFLAMNGGTGIFLR